MVLGGSVQLSRLVHNQRMGMSYPSAVAGPIFHIWNIDSTLATQRRRFCPFVANQCFQPRFQFIAFHGKKKAMQDCRMGQCMVLWVVFVRVFVRVRMWVCACVRVACACGVCACVFAGLPVCLFLCVRCVFVCMRARVWVFMCPCVYDTCVSYLLCSSLFLFFLSTGLNGLRETKVRYKSMTWTTGKLVNCTTGLARIYLSLHVHVYVMRQSCITPLSVFLNFLSLCLFQFQVVGHRKKEKEKIIPMRANGILHIRP